MKEYTRDYQIEMSIDWFFLDQNDLISQFSSVGGILPGTVAKNAEDNEIINEFVKTIEPYSEVIVNPLLDRYFDTNNISSIISYGYFATKGLLSFDKTHCCAGDFDITYHLIAAPVEPLDFNSLPDKIKEIMLKNKQMISFKDFHKIDAGYIPWASLFEDYEIKPLYDPPAKKKKTFWW
jgi:hypothetical protein